MVEPTSSIVGFVIFLILLIISLTSFGYIIYRRLQVILNSQPQNRFDQLGKRLTVLLSIGFGQKRILSRSFWFAGILHVLIFWGFIVVAFNTITMIGNGFKPGFVLPGFDLSHRFGQIYAQVKDIFEVLVLLSVGVALFRRLIKVPRRLTFSWEANLILGLIAILMVTELLMSGCQVRVNPAVFSTMVARQIAAILPQNTPLSAIFQASWWLHLVTLLFFLPYLPLSKHFHIITALPNVFFRRLDRGSLRFIDLGNSDHYGVACPEHFTWKDWLDVFSCTECGRCQMVCPAYLSGKPLSPKEFNLTLRQYINVVQPVFQLRKAQSDENRAVLAGEVIEAETIWACNMCRACEETCPLTIEFIDRFVELRRHLVLEKSQFPPELTQTFRNLEVYGNPWGSNPDARLRWAENLNVPILSDLKAPVDYLFWVGCAGAFDSEAQKTTQAMVKILQSAGISFAILGSEEVCTGDLARRLGNEYLFQTLAQQNIATFERYGIRRIITQCAHCFNTLKNEYSQLGTTLEVISHVDFIAQLLQNGKLKITKPLSGKLTVHDSCYLGRYNGQYAAPRTILRALETEFVELPHRGKNAFCCGAGGGHMWLEERPEERVNRLRVAEINALAPDVVATICPFCTIMLQDGLKENPTNHATHCADVAVLVAESI